MSTIQQPTSSLQPSASVQRTHLPASTGTAAAPQDQVSLGAATTSSTPGTWTVLVYANGNDTNLTRLAPAVLRQLEAAGSNANLSIAAQVSRSPFVTDRFSGDWSGARRFDVQKNPNPPAMIDELKSWFVPPYTGNIVSPVVADLGQADMGDPKTFTDFVEWGVKAHPADHYALVVFGQGGGFVGALQDSQTGHALTPAQIADGLKAASRTTGQPFDVVALDAGLTSGLETADALTGAARVLVASEGPVKLGGMPLDAVMKDLKFDLGDGKDMTAEDLARWFVFEARYQPAPLAQQTATSATAIDLDRVAALKSSWNQLGNLLQTALASRPELKEALRAAMAASQGFDSSNNPNLPYGDFRDIGSFVQNLKADPQLSTISDIREAAERVESALQKAVIDEFHVAGFPSASGLSAYMPLDYGYDMPTTWLYPRGFDPKHGYGQTSLAQGTSWDELLGAVAQDTPSHERLRKLGVPSAVIHELDVLSRGASKLTALALSLARRAGHVEAAQAMRQKPPIGFMGMSAEVAVKVGAVGGAYQAFEGAQKVLQAATDEEMGNRLVMGVDGSADFVTGAAVTACMIGMSAAKAAAIATPAGYVAYAVPIAKTVFDLMMARRKAADAKEQSASLPPELRRQQLEARSSETSSAPEYVSPAVTALVEAASAAPIDPSTVVPTPATAAVA